MEASCIRFAGERAGAFADAFLESKAEEARHSINKRGVRNIHTYEGEEFTQVVYERGSSHDNSWLQVSVTAEHTDGETVTVAVFVGGGGQGPFKLEEVNVARLTKGEGAVGEAGRFASVLRDVRGVAEALDLRVETEWESESDDDVLATLERKIFDS